MNDIGAAYDTSGKLVNINPYDSNMRPLFECNSTCNCYKDCVNRNVQRGIRTKLQMFSTQKKGYGLKTLEFIGKNSFVCEYAGEVLTVEEARQRTSLILPSDTNFILTINEQFSSRKEVTYIDPTNKGNIGRYINHSCCPNLFMVPVRVDDFIPRVALFALRDIDAGEELSYDYSGDLSEIIMSYNSDSKTDRAILVVAHTEGHTPCHCGSTICKRFLPIDPSLYQ